VALESLVALLFLAGPCFGRHWQVFRCSSVATQTAFIKCLATPTTGALDWAVAPSTRFLFWMGVSSQPTIFAVAPKEGLSGSSCAPGSCGLLPSPLYLT
jgi:hypothetical protein